MMHSRTSLPLIEDSQEQAGGNPRTTAATFGLFCAAVWTALRDVSLVTALIAIPSACFTIAALAQSPAASRQIGTVKSVSPGKLTISTDAGQSFSINVVDDAHVLQLAPGSTDLKTAVTIKLDDIEVGDRILVTGHADAADAMTASRVILMKSTDIAQKHEAEQDDWQNRGAGGLVSAIDPATGTLTITARGKSISVKTLPATIYRRYAGDSVKYQDARAGTLNQIQSGDQVRVRGAKDADGSTIEAEEIVSGSFKNLAGTIVSIDATAGTLTIRDLATKKTYAVKVTAKSSLHTLPPQMAARFAARARGAQSGNAAVEQKPSPAVQASATQASMKPGEPHRGEAESASAGMDLSQMVNRLPQGSLSDLHAGDALMVVASLPGAGSVSLTAITLLSGVEPILAASPSGAPSMTLSPWNVGGPEGGGA